MLTSEFLYDWLRLLSFYLGVYCVLPSVEHLVEYVFNYPEKHTFEYRNYFNIASIICWTYFMATIH
jgi:hypothetical protein